MQPTASHQPFLSVAADNSGGHLPSGQSRQKVQRYIGNIAMLRGADDGLPMARRDAVPSLPLLHHADIDPDVFGEGLSRGPRRDHGSEAVHGRMVRNVPRDCKTKRTRFPTTFRIMYSDLPTHLTRPCERLQWLRVRARFKTPADAAKQFGWNPNSYKSHENGFRGIRKDAAEKYAAAYKVPVIWLLHGAKIAAADLSEEERALIASFRRMDRRGRLAVQTTAESLAQASEETEATPSTGD